MIKYLAFIFVLFIGTCSAPTLAHEEDLSKPVAEARNSFTYIMMTVKLSPKNCVFIERSSGVISKRTCDLSDLPAKYIKSFGSGTVISHGVNSTYILTAAHVCSYPRIDKKVVDHRIVSVEIKPMPKVRDVMGNEYKAQIFSLDSKNDLCVLRAEGIFGKPIPIADKMPETPARVYSYGAPLAVNHPGMVLFFEGYTSGYRYDTRIGRKDFFFTIPIRSGSSGSSVMNRRGEIVGVVHTAIIQMENIAISASLESIQEIVKSIPKVYYQKTGP